MFKAEPEEYMGFSEIEVRKSGRREWSSIICNVM